MDSSLGPFLIPIVALMIPIVAIVGGVWSQAQKNRLIAEQRMAMLARGMPITEIEAALSSPSLHDSEGRGRDPMRSLGAARRAAVVLMSTGLGLCVFGILLEWIVGVRQVLVVAAAGLIPLAIGLGFLVDYMLQKRELSRFRMEVGADVP